MQAMKQDKLVQKHGVAEGRRILDAQKEKQEQMAVERRSESRLRRMEEAKRKNQVRWTDSFVFHMCPNREEPRIGAKKLMQKVWAWAEELDWYGPPRVRGDYNLLTGRSVTEIRVCPPPLTLTRTITP